MSFVLVMAVQHEADGDMRDERLKSERRWAAKHSSVTQKSESDVSAPRAEAGKTSRRSNRYGPPVLYTTTSRIMFRIGGDFAPLFEPVGTKYLRYLN